ncbi:MAG: hypothetical protein Q8N31_17145 [Reyranella sp.]|nr:hypothetical protein [Reyranella sp.]MDP3161744.1 hypothetical protein [Reyranella sp.]
MQQQTAMKVAGAILLVAFLGLVTMVVTSPGSFLHDGPEYVKYVPLLRQHGLTEAFLDSLPGAAGPLYAFVHLAFAPLTDLRPVGMRLVNVALLVVVAGILAAWLRQQNCRDYLVAACSILIVPMTWVMAGLALTEMPAMVFATLSLYLLLKGVEALEQEHPVLRWFAASGICLAVAVWGRQPYLLLAAVPVVMALLDRRLRIAALVFAAIVATLTIPLIIAWEGLVPPADGADEGLSLLHGAISLGYAGICFFLLVPRLQWFFRKPFIVAAIILAALNAWYGIVVYAPVETLASAFLSEGGMAAYSVACGSLMLVCGLTFLAWMLATTWRDRGDLKKVAINVGLLCIVLSPAFIANFYASRYTAMALPYLILAAQPWRKWGWQTTTATIIGCAMGLVSLQGYYLLK